MDTIAWRVNNYVTAGRPRAYCDDCIADALILSRRQQAARVTGALETTNDFIRESDECATCGTVKKVIRRA
ncbi:MAG: hypothetical protein ACO1NM_14515 [Sphingobium phenoxybenzoativorans]